MTAPRWSDSEQGDLLELVALGTPQGTADAEWQMFLTALRHAAVDGIVTPNRMRPLCRHFIAPRRISAFYSRAMARDLIAPTGEWELSDDREGKNAGRPMRTYRVIGDLA